MPEKEDEMTEDFTSNFNGENLEVFLKESRRLEEQVYDRAREMLTPEQLKVFAKSQEAHRTMQEFGMKMGVQMMKGAKEE